MKKLHLPIISLALLLGLVQSYAADSINPAPDFQFRIPLHVQYLNLYTNRLGSFGLAGWTIFPDLTARNNETANLYLFGPLWQYDKKGSWLEIMGGFKRNEDGYNDPFMDLRLFDRTIPRINFSAELAYFPSKERKRFYTLVAIDTPIPIGTYQIRVGLESENIVSYAGKNDSLGIGPRLVLPIPLQKVSPSLSSSLTLAYQCRNDQDFVRAYFSLTYVFGKR